MTATESAPTGADRWVQRRVAPTLMWGAEGRGLHTRVSVANYYSLLDGRAAVEADVLVDLIASDGTVAGRYRSRLGPHEHDQIELATITQEFEGMIALRLVPDPEPEHRHRYLGTLYFVTWYDDLGHVQFSHEQNRMTFEDDGSTRSFLSPGIQLRPELDVSVIVQRSYFGAMPLADEEVSLTVHASDGSSLASTTVSLPRGCSRVVDLDVLGSFEASGGSVAVQVRGTHLNHPFTYIRHRSGDFSIHHF